MSLTRPTVLLATNFCPPYRRPLFERLVQDRQWSQALLVFDVLQESNRTWSEGDLGRGTVRMFSFSVPRWVRHSVAGYRERRDLQLPLGLLPLLLRYRPDVVVSAELGVRSALAALYARLFRRGLVLWICATGHGEQGRSGARRWWRRRLLACAGAVMVNGLEGEAYVRALAPGAPAVRRDAVFRVAYTVDNERYYTTPEQPRPVGDRIRVLVVGQLLARKGLRQLLAALQPAPEACARLHVRFVGDGPLRAEVAAGIGRLAPRGLAAEAVGHVSWDALPATYAWGDVLLFPTLDDEWGIVVNEAMAAGLPVVGSRYAGAALELVREGETGWLFDPLDAPAFVAVLRRMAATPRDVFHAMGQRARAAIGAYSYDVAYDRLAGAVQQALAATSRAAQSPGPVAPGGRC